MLTLESIYAGYGKKEVLRGVSFSLNQGEILAIIGPNGAGKSTLLKVIAGLLNPLKGKIIYEGKDITKLNCNEKVKNGVIYFIQGGQVFPSLSVRENLEIGAMGTDGKIEMLLKDIFLLFPKLEGWLFKRAGLLSGGQRQQVALAMILMKRPRVLLLDEPSAGLSPKFVKEIINKIKKINNLFGTTIILVEQNIKEALQTAHRAIVIVNGSLALETVNPLELLKEGALETFFFGKSDKFGGIKD
jgi:branched-chain amino acid transport system ATP-binding protein